MRPCSSRLAAARLIYKVTECLDTICIASTVDATLLYACVLEAQRIGDHLQTIASLQRILKKYDYGAPNGVHVPALLRYTPYITIEESFAYS